MLLGLAFAVIHVNTAYAAASGATDEVLVKIQAALSPAVGLLQTILWPILLMIGSLLQNDLLFGAGMEERLLLVWVNIRNIVNILFVFILLTIAFYNVVGAGENYHLKKELPKFIIALIAVNFTYIAAKVVLDGVNIVSTALFALPNSVQAGLKSAKEDTAPRIGILTMEQGDGVCSGMIGVPIESPGYKKKLVEIMEADKDKKPHSFCLSEKPKKDGTEGSILTEKAKTFFTQFGSQNAALVLAIAMGKTNLLSSIKDLPPESQTVANLIKNSLFSVIFYVIYATAFVALFVVLLVRLIALWVMIALSPLMVLKYVLPQGLVSKLGAAGELQTKFIHNAIVPIPIALVLSIGFIMLDALQKADFNKLNKFNFLQTKTLDIDLLTSGISTLQELMVALGMVGFLWVGVFEALKGTYAEGAVKSIQGAVSGMGSFLGKLPLMAPIFPIGGSQKASLGELGYMAGQLKYLPERQFQKDADTHFSGLLGGHGSQAQKMIDNTDLQKAQVKYIEDNRTKFNDAWKNMSPATKQTYKTPTEFINALRSGTVKDPKIMEDYLRHMGIKEDGLPSGAGDASTSAEEGHLNGDQNKQFKKYKEEPLVKEGKLTDGEAETLKKLDEALKSKNKDKTEVAKKIEEAKKEAQPVFDKLEAIESAENTIRLDIGQVGDSPTEEQKEQFIKQMEAKIEELIKQGMAKPDAEKSILQAASKGMSASQHAEFTKEAPGSLLKQAADAKGSTPAVPPPKPGVSTASTGTTTPIAKPPAPPPPLVGSKENPKSTTAANAQQFGYKDAKLPPSGTIFEGDQGRKGTWFKVK